MMEPKTLRNAKIVKLRDENPQKWSFYKLGEKFNIRKQTVHEIYNREKRRQELSTDGS